MLITNDATASAPTDAESVPLSAPRSTARDRNHAATRPMSSISSSQASSIVPPLRRCSAANASRARCMTPHIDAGTTTCGAATANLPTSRTLAVLVVLVVVEVPVRGGVVEGHREPVAIRDPGGRAPRRRTPARHPCGRRELVAIPRPLDHHPGGRVCLDLAPFTRWHLGQQLEEAHVVALARGDGRERARPRRVRGFP